MAEIIGGPLSCFQELEKTQFLTHTGTIYRDVGVINRRDGILWHSCQIEYPQTSPRIASGLGYCRLYQ